MKCAGRFVRWMMIVGASGLMPAFIMRCDKAALNLQRGFLWGAGMQTAEWVFDPALWGLDGAE